MIDYLSLFMIRFLPMKKVIITADDFGIHSSANKAIVDLYQKKAISSASLMVNMGKSSEEAVELANLYNMPVGLHFNLTLNNPKYKNRADFEKQFILGKVSKVYIKEELQKQYDYLANKALKPAYLDSHQHIHNFPGVFNILAKFAKEKNIPVRIVEEWPVINPYQKLEFKDLKQIIRKIIFLFFAWFNRLQAKIIGIKTNNRLTSLFALLPRPQQVDLKHLELIFQRVKNNSEYMCHPLIEKITLTSIADISVQEYGLMTNKIFLDMIKNNKIQLINYGEL